jgi:hypothetical protein
MQKIAPFSRLKKNAEEKRGSQTFYCFSPPVMIATMIIEVTLALYTFLRYRRGKFAKLAGVLIVLLSVFQLSEYQICAGQRPEFWSHLGFIAVTFLPIVGLQLVSMVSKKHLLITTGYAIAISFSLIFIFIPQSIAQPFCGGNYIIFSAPAMVYELYGAYYFAFLIFAIVESLMTIQEHKMRRAHRLLRWIVIGYLSFMLPMGIVYAIYAPARIAVASIMCGFAVILACVIAFQIVPQYYRYIHKEK